MIINVEKFIAKFKNLELVELYIPIKEELKKTMFHRRVKNKDNPRYFIDYWHTGKFRSLEGSYQHSGYEDKYLKAEIEKLAAYREKTVPLEEHNTHGEIVTFGKHKGERWTRLPVSYLRWLANESTMWRPMALAELKRRGTVMDAKVEISGHAIDRASLSCRRIWHDTAEEGEGLNAWLVRIATEAIEARGERELIRWKGLKMAFTYGEFYPILKTIMPYKEDLQGKASISLISLQVWLKDRLKILETRKEEAETLDKKKMMGARATSYREIIGYILTRLGNERDVILDNDEKSNG